MKNDTPVNRGLSRTPGRKLPAQSAISEITELHADILDAAQTSFTKAIRIGELLTEIKAGLEHGQWLPWLEKNVPFTDRTARNYIRLFDERDRLKSESVSDLTTAYRLLAPPREPEETTREGKGTLANRCADIEKQLDEAVPSVRAALIEIRDKQLYRENHDTFADYCREEWGWDVEGGSVLVPFPQLGDSYFLRIQLDTETA